MDRYIPINHRLARAIEKNVESMDRARLEALVAEQLHNFFEKEATHEETLGFIEAIEHE